jgi:hypothetical protein
LRPDLALQLADSEVRAVTASEGLVRIAFSAARARSRGRGVHGFLRAVELVFERARATGELALCIGRVADGSLRIDGRRGDIGIPLRHVGAAALAIRFANGEQLVVEGNLLEIHLPVDAHLHEDFSC